MPHKIRSLTADINRLKTKWIGLNYFVLGPGFRQSTVCFDRQIRPTPPNGVRRKFQLRCFPSIDVGPVTDSTNMLSAQITPSAPLRPKNGGGVRWTSVPLSATAAATADSSTKSLLLGRQSPNQKNSNQLRLPSDALNSCII